MTGEGLVGVGLDGEVASKNCPATQGMMTVKALIDRYTTSATSKNCPATQGMMTEQQLKRVVDHVLELQRTAPQRRG